MRDLGLNTYRGDFVPSLSPLQITNHRAASKTYHAEVIGIEGPALMPDGLHWTYDCDAMCIRIHSGVDHWGSK